MKCDFCKLGFPPNLLSPMSISGKYTKPICPICALKTRNKIHGLPENEPFQGETASFMWEEATEINEKRKK